jgi:hypothetical protein
MHISVDRFVKCFDFLVQGLVSLIDRECKPGKRKGAPQERGNARYGTFPKDDTSFIFVILQKDGLKIRDAVFHGTAWFCSIFPDEEDVMMAYAAALHIDSRDMHLWKKHWDGGFGHKVMNNLRHRRFEYASMFQAALLEDIGSHLRHDAEKEAYDRYCEKKLEDPDHPGPEKFSVEQFAAALDSHKKEVRKGEVSMHMWKQLV